VPSSFHEDATTALLALDAGPMIAVGPIPTEETARLRRWQSITVGYLVLGYAGYYLCRSDFSVSIPYIIEDLKAGGMDGDVAKVRLGWITSAGTLAYALGKFAGGMFADAFGGRRNMLLGMLGAVVCTLLFASGRSLAIFALAWAGNRLVQSFGWPGMVKIVSKWFTPARYGSAMGVVSLSYLFGDAASRAFMDRLFRSGFEWRAVFAIAAATLGALLIAGLWLLKESPESIGAKLPGGDHDLEPIEAEADERPPVLRLLGSPAFCMVCLLSFGLTLLRETFGTWTPTYFVQAIHIAKEDAVGLSGLFPLAGGVSVLLAGFLADRLGRDGRMAVVCVGMALAGMMMAGLAWGNFGASKGVPVAMVTATAFLMIGPYSYLAGAVSLDFGGRSGAASASGLIDGIGYLGGVLAGAGMAEVSVKLGWSGAFAVLAAVAMGTSALSAWIFWSGLRRKGKVAG
jgi:sugar phosphate permease